MEILIYNDLDYSKAKKQFDKVVGFLKADDFKSADVKKMVNTGFYRAKLDDTTRLLFKYTKINGKTYLLLLEVIYNHDYEKSRFLNDVVIDESKFVAVTTADKMAAEDITPINYVNSQKKTFHILDKILSFDDIQDEVFNLPSPLIVIGSAGSGKTALTLEKIKTLNGNILYTTLSAFLVENSQNLYYSYNYDNEKQEIDFLSFNEYLNALEIPKGKEIDFRAFEQWIWRFKQSHKVKDAYKIYEEFKGVLTGCVVDKPYLSKEDYLNLGVKQSIFLQEEREMVYDLFSRYLTFLEEGTYYDSNIVAYNYLKKVQPKYDYVVVDEVQDITNIQLFLIIKSLNNPTNFILCGDSNQIVHPNFFSWTNIKSMFYKQELKGNIIRVLATNYRNTPEVTAIANQLLMVKNARFGSIDKESTYLVKPNSQHKGEVQFMENVPKIKQDLNNRTKKSAKFAVIVMRNEDKDEARKFFNTPLLFSIHEIKGLEYENVILYNVISKYEKEFREITVGVNKADLVGEINFSRAKDKTDKALDEYKFYINSLYVAMTRAVKNLYVLETNKKHALLELLGLTNFSSQVTVKEQTSTNEDWQKEARRLEMQGKKEQADAIRKDILQIKPVPWTVMMPENLQTFIDNALNPQHFNKKGKDALFEYAAFYNTILYYEKLSELKYRDADEANWQREKTAVLNKKLTFYKRDDLRNLQTQFKQYGVDFRNEYNFTPLMLAVMTGAEATIRYLLENGADKTHSDNLGRNALHLLMLAKLSAPKEQQYHKNLNKLYPVLKQDSIKLKINNRFIKIDSHQAEFLMLNFLLAANRDFFLHNYLPEKEQNMGNLQDAYIGSADFLLFFEGLTQQVIPEYRTKRSYISSILSKNEMNSESKYSKQLFLRVTQGKYIINPNLEVWVNEEWKNFYSLIGFNTLQEELNIKMIKKVEEFYRHYKVNIEHGKKQWLNAVDFYFRTVKKAMKDAEKAAKKELAQENKVIKVAKEGTKEVVIKKVVKKTK
jgi:hypothetical protein